MSRSRPSLGSGLRAGAFLVPGLRAGAFLVSLLLALVAPALPAAPEAPELWWAMGPSTMEKYGLDPNLVVAARVSGDGRRVFVVQHRFGAPVRLLVLDAREGRQVADLPLNEGVVSAFAPSQDGSEVFFVADYGAWAGVVEVPGGRVRRVFEARPGQGFRFTPPITVVPHPSGAFMTRGYFQAGGVTEGDYLVSFQADGTLERRVDLGRLLRRSGMPGGQILGTAVSADCRRAVWVVATAPDQQRLFTGLVEEDTPAVAVDRAARFGALALTDSGDRALYGVSLAGEGGGLRELRTATGRVEVLEAGRFAPVALSPDGTRMLVGRIVREPDRMRLFYLARKGLTGLTVANWKEAPAYYALARDGQTFVLWSRERIAVGRLP